MANMWRCPECETLNTEDKCIICGCSKPKTINNTSRPNIVQEQLKISDFNQGSLKSIQNSNQYKIDNRQDSINSVKTHTSNRKKKNKKIPIIIVSCVTVIFVACVSSFISLDIIKNYVDSANKLEETLPSFTTISTTALQLDVASITNESTVTEAPVSEEETTTTVVPESVTENVVEGDMVVMPSLVKQDFVEATKILDELGLQYKITYSDKKYVDVGENCVYSQNPATGKEIKRDTVVELGISTYQQATTKPTTVPQTTPPVIATRTKQITKDIEIPINNAKMTNGSWNQSISLDKTDFDCSCITPDTIVKVEFELGAPSSKLNAPVELILQNYTSDPQIWAKIAPFEYDYDKKSASFDYKSMVSSYGSDDFSTVDCLHIGDRGVYIKVTRLTITNCSVNSELFDEKNDSGTNKTTENSTTSEYKMSWNETEIHETFYIKSPCYSRTEAVVGAETVKKYEVGTKIDVVAATTTGYYKLKDGTFIHSDYVTDEKPWSEAEKSTAMPKLNKTSVTLTKGYQTTLSVSNSSSVTWFTGDKSIATVSSKGKVIGKNPGTTYIYAKTGSTTLKCKVTVVASKITANKSSVTLDKVGATATVTFTVKGSHSGLAVGTTNKKVATVAFVRPAKWDGDKIKIKITAKGAGSARIKLYNENYPLTCYKYVDVSVEDITD